MISKLSLERLARLVQENKLDLPEEKLKKVSAVVAQMQEGKFTAY